MTRRRAATAGGLALGLAAAFVTGAPAATEERKGSAFGFKGLTEVRELVVTWAPGGSEVQIAAHLATGLTIKDKMKDGDDVTRLLEISRSFAMPRARLAVTLEGDAIVSYHLATGAGR